MPSKKSPSKKPASPLKKSASVEKNSASPLEKYDAKRNFQNTPEPAGKIAAKTGHSYVIQEHHARSHHFDFRLEMDGVLVSWAVPKGVPEDKAAKRLAVHVEDHPLKYGSFSGTIPKGNYGAGEVAIWDKGVWEPLDKDWRKSFQNGKIKFVLRGDRLQGTYVLARMKEEPNWLLRLVSDDLPVDPEAPLPVEEAKFISPQLARIVPTVPTGQEWLHEIKFDGYRIIAVQKNGKVSLYTRSGLHWTGKFLSVAKNLQALTKKDFVLDGEAVVFDEKGHTNFGDLQSALEDKASEEIVYIAFDILHFDGKNLRDLPLNLRLPYLANLVKSDFGPVRISKTWPAEMGKELFDQAKKNGLEGIISKSATGRYLEGSRKDWVKSKCRAHQEFVICGYMPPKSSLPGFSALVLGSYEAGKLVPRGKVGTGFSEDERLQILKKLKLKKMKTPHFDFPEKDIVWIKPDLVAEIQFAEITRSGSIRQGSFIAMREDKKTKDVHLDGVQITRADAKDAKVAGITISHPDRLVFPADGICKMEVAEYYEKVSELMLPFIINRPLAILRAPAGITGEVFFQKSFPTHLPAEVLQKELEDGTEVFYIKNAKGIISLAQFGMIEIHPWGSSFPKVENPDFLIWDLDPDAAVPWSEVLGAAMLLRDFLKNLGLETLVKTSGGKGLHIVLPIKRTQNWEDMRTFSKAVASKIAEFNPNKFVVTATKAKRTGKIYIDWMRNGRGSTCVAPWGLRARAGGKVSMPLNWEQIPDLSSNGYTMRDPVETPSEWKNFKFQTLTKKVAAEFL